jgi:hypothetical protein
MNLQNHLGGLRERLLACRATNGTLAAASGGVLSESWISKFRAGHMVNPRVDTLMALETALEACEPCAAPLRRVANA